MQTLFGCLGQTAYDSASNATKPKYMGNKYSFNDFAIRQVANLLGHSADVDTYTNRSFVRALCSVVAHHGFVSISRAYLRGDSEDVSGHHTPNSRALR